MKKNYTFINRVWDALDFSAGAQWFKDFCNGNEHLIALGCNNKTAFIKFSDEERYFTVAELTDKITDKNDPVIGELEHATTQLYSEYSGMSDFGFDTKSMVFWDVDETETKHYWLITAIYNIVAA